MLVMRGCLLHAFARHLRNGGVWARRTIRALSNYSFFLLLFFFFLFVKSHTLRTRRLLEHSACDPDHDDL